MEYEIHEEAEEELLDLPEKVRKILKEEIDSRKRRENSILDQRGVGISYDSHGNPVHYFKMEEKEVSYRVFFNILDGKVVILGARPRNDDTYLNLRDYTRMKEKRN